MTESDRTAIAVHTALVGNQAQIKQDHDRLGGQGFVQFDDVELTQPNADETTNLARIVGLTKNASRAS